ncbi:uncharacterized protein LOC126743514 isoform X2 [Anthonomus grandis grandis]|uniref:uncharacterized protein LOC126743514 isoform X2 n=1 Tax=Anthonomus grandis grandis TaxID=2921223 RepID=UPI00216543F4|nr:uncharacterized protein LOC126743514 isoform X2 [Anthonomus grandis grandis]
MVCKEEILTWFKDLDSYRRIDLLCELINMCIPFELRFVGSYLEEIGKHSFHELRTQAMAANEMEKLEKDPVLKNKTLRDEVIRHRMLINVSLLKSRNYSVANWYSDKFLRTDSVSDIITKEADDKVLNELLLLYTMAARHPAFTFEQRDFFSQMLLKLFDIRESRQLIKPVNFRSLPPGFEFQNACNYRNMKSHDGPPFPLGLAMHHPPGLPPHFEFMGQFRTGWPAMPFGAPAEVTAFPLHQQIPMQPPQPATSPLVNSPSQSRSGSPRTHARPFTILTSASGTVPVVNPVVVVPPGLQSTAPAMMPVPHLGGSSVEANLSAPPPPLSHPAGPSSQPSPVYNSPNPTQTSKPETEELKEQTPTRHPPPPPPSTVNPWMLPPPVVSAETTKHMNGLRIGFPSLRTSVAEQMQSMTLTDESSHYHSSSSSSPLQTPPETPSNLVQSVTTSSSSTPAHRTHPEKTRAMNGLPGGGGFMPPFGMDPTTSPPPPHQPYPFGHYPLPRYITTGGNFRPITSTGGGFPQFPPPNQQQGGDNMITTTAYHHTYPIGSFIPYLYSGFPPPPPPPSNSCPSHPPNPPPLPPPRNYAPGCYNCGAASHLGPECTKQSIDDITQQNTYR